MNINLTLIVQMLVFALLIFITMKWIWPPILAAMDERSRKIAQGLAAAEKGQQALTQAHGNAEAIIREARERATQIIDQAQHRANEMVEEAKGTANVEGARLVAAAQPADRAGHHTRARGPAQGSGRHRRRSGLQAPRARDRCAQARRAARPARHADLSAPMADKITIARPYARAAFEEAASDDRRRSGLRRCTRPRRWCRIRGSRRCSAIRT